MTRENFPDFLPIRVSGWSRSGQSAPFSIVNHQSSSRRLGARFPVPMVFGFQDEIHGTLVSYLDSRGIPALGFEGGQHESKKVIVASIEKSPATAF